MKMLEAMVAWNPNGEIKVGEWPDQNGWSREFERTSGACYSSWHSMKKTDLLLQIFILFNSITVRDGVPVSKVHDAFLSIDEYCYFITPDTPGAKLTEKEKCNFLDTLLSI